MHFGGTSMTMGNHHLYIYIYLWLFHCKPSSYCGISMIPHYGKLHILAASFRKLKPGDVLLEVAGKPCLNFVLLG